MFKKFHLITIAIVTAVWLLFVLTSIFVKNSLSNQVIQQNYEQYGDNLASTIVNNVWSKYFPIIGYLQTQSEEMYETFPQFNSLMAEMRELTNVHNLLSTKIHLNNGQILEIDDVDIKENLGFFGSLFSSSFDNITSIKSIRSKVVKSAQVTRGNSTSNTQVIKVFAPVKLNANNLSKELSPLALQAEGVLELNFDITQNLKSISWLFFIAIILITLAVITIVILFVITSNKVEKFSPEEGGQIGDLVDKNKFLEEASKEKAKLIAKLGHELRTPLNAIIGFAEILKNESMGEIDNPQYKEFISDIHKSGQHLLNVVNNILDSARNDGDLQEITLEEVDFTKVVKETMQSLIAKASEKKLNLSHNITGYHLIVNSNPKRIKQIMANIFSTISKVAQLDSEVVIKLWHDEEKKIVNLTFSDTALNYSEEELNVINSKKSEEVEISISQKITELMHGKFTVSKSDGRGTIFFISFPLVDAIPPLEVKKPAASELQEIAQEEQQNDAPAENETMEQQNLSEPTLEKSDSIEENNNAEQNESNQERSEDSKGEQ